MKEMQIPHSGGKHGSNSCYNCYSCHSTNNSPALIHHGNDRPISLNKHKNWERVKEMAADGEDVKFCHNDVYWRKPKEARDKITGYMVTCPWGTTLPKGNKKYTPELLVHSHNSGKGDSKADKKKKGTRTKITARELHSQIERIV
jgi:hypothetical protein